MQVKWGKMAAKITVWLTAEILLNLVGLDNLADYGEFVSGEYLTSQRPFQMVLQSQQSPKHSLDLVS